MIPPLATFIHAVFKDGTLAKERTADELLEVLNAHPDRVEGTNAFLVTGEDSLNELAPVELLAGKPFSARVIMAKEIAEGKHDGKPFVHLYSGPGYTDGVHTSQQRLFDLSLEERAGKVIHVARFPGTE